MRRLIWPLLAIPLLVIAAYLIRASAATGPRPGPRPARAAPQTTPIILNVRIADYAYDPAELTVPVGGTVVWLNADADPHSATGDLGDWDTGVLEQGQSANFTFAAPGTYSYFCSVHVEMGGSITVVGPPAATATAAPTLTAAPTPASGPPTAAPTLTAAPAGAENYLPLLIAPPAATR